MTTPEPPAPESPAADGAAKQGRSPGVVAAIVIVVVIALVGGAFLVYKLTQSKDEPKPALAQAKAVMAAITSGSTSELRSLSTGQGTAQLLALKPSDADGLTITAASCKKFGAEEPTRVCTATRPGGALTMRLVFTDNAWKVDLVTIGPAALPPTSSTTATTVAP